MHHERRGGATGEGRDVGGLPISSRELYQAGHIIHDISVWASVLGGRIVDASVSCRRGASEPCRIVFNFPRIEKIGHIAEFYHSESLEGNCLGKIIKVFFEFNTIDIRVSMA